MAYFWGFLLITDTHSIALWSVDNESADRSVTIGASITDANKLLATGILVIWT
jgi:hypothetical protein